MKFLASIMHWLHIGKKADLARVYITGHASGANMVFHMMSQYIEDTNEKDRVEFVLAGGSASAGSFLTCLNDPRIAQGVNADWGSLKPRPFMYFQGLQDINSWCAGGGMYRHVGEHAYSTEQMAASFAQRNKCGMMTNGDYKMKKYTITPEMDADLSSTATLWEFLDCEAPVVVYTFSSMDHILQRMNVFMYKQKMKFFLGEWKPPGRWYNAKWVTSGLADSLSTKTGSKMCGCCNEATGACNYNAACDGKQYLQTVTCPGVEELQKKCWTSADLQDNPVCWWVTSEDDD